MATTRTSKIRVRQGNFSDLPVLDPGELGYAKDSRRLFIGNDTVNVGTGNGVLLGFTLPLAVSKPTITTVFVDEGMTMKRIRPRAKGRADRIFKRTCHITVKVGQD